MVTCGQRAGESSGTAEKRSDAFVLWNRCPLNYYNEHDPKAAAWLSHLMTDGLIPPGCIDTRDIREVEPHELKEFTQCHFFAGIGGWSEALRLAGWAEDVPVWTGSCPCQPYSAAGKGKGDADERNLWPVLWWLIRECRPDVVFGEQVESAIRHGWLDGVQADLEAEGYTVGHCVLGAHSVGAPHIRKRLYWGGRLANAGGPEWRRRSESEGEHGASFHVADGCESDGLVDADGARFTETRESQQPERRRRLPCPRCRPGGLVHSIGPRLEGHAGNGDDGRESGRDAAEPDRPIAEAGGVGGWRWLDSAVINCRDGRSRRIPVEPSLFPLADGVPGRVGLLRGAGNAIVPQVAAEFVRSFADSIV